VDISMSIQNPEQQQNSVPMSDMPLVLPFTAIDATFLSLVGGKAANLGEMIQAGLPVPPGFCVTTAAYELATKSASLEAILDELAGARADDTALLEKCAASVRALILATPIPDSIMETI